MNAPVQTNLITAQISQLSAVLGLHNVDPAELEQTSVSYTHLTLPTNREV